MSIFRLLLILCVLISGFFTGMCVSFLWLTGGEVPWFMYQWQPTVGFVLMFLSNSLFFYVVGKEDGVFESKVSQSLYRDNML